MTVDQQLALLRARVCIPRPEPLCGREYVFNTPPELAAQGITVVSGHHNTTHFAPNRIIIDESGGMSHADLSCIILPERTVLNHRGQRRGELD